MIHGVLGPEDSLVRYGGDEFIILMPRRAQHEALETTRRLRRTLNQTALLQDEGLSIKVTASYGIASLPEDARDRESCCSSPTGPCSAAKTGAGTASW